jgi:hypothetical protein
LAVLSQKQWSDRPSGHGFRAMIWGKDKTTNDLLESLEQAFSLELGIVDAINYARSKRIEETTEKIRQNIESMSSWIIRLFCCSHRFRDEA